MQRLFLLLFLLASGLFSNSQGKDSMHVKWVVSVQHSGGSNYNLQFTGLIQEGWHIYAPDQEEGLAGVVVSYPDSSLKAGPVTMLSTTAGINDPIFEKGMEVFEGQFKFAQQITFEGKVIPQMNLNLTYETADKGNFIPEEQELNVVFDSSKASQAVTGSRLLIPTIDLKNPVSDCGATSPANFDAASSGLASIFFLGFLGGLVALLTPCVFPMIPLTVSFFTKKSGSNKKKGIFHAFLYGFFIFLIYVLLSLPFHFLDQLNPEILNNISTNVYLNVFFFAIFVFFAFSFFGFYELTLPSSITNKADSKSSAGTLLGIFFMALTLAIVSFSCTGPILGSLLAGSLSRDGGAIQLTMGMAGFGLALALPFALFALFPNWLNSLPKSGGWLTTVKVVLGFLELGLALKFLSNADLVMHWGILKREVFIGIWVLIGIGLTLYLFGKLRFPHDSPVKKLHPFRLGLAVISDFSMRVTGNAFGRSRYDYLYNYPYGGFNDYYYYNPSYYNYYRPFYYRNQTTTHYFYDNILIMSLDPNFKVQWNAMVIKKQGDVETDNFLSFSNIISGGEIHYLYMEPEKRNQVVINNGLSPSGKLTRYGTLKGNVSGYSFMPKLSKQVGANQVILPCLYRGYIAFAKVDFSG